MTNKTCKKWTEREERLLVDAVQANPQNLSKGFKEVAVKTGRTCGAVRLHWYTVLSNPANSKYVGTSFLILSKKAVCENKKTVSCSIPYSPEVIKVSIWNKIKSLLGIKKR